MNVEQYKNKVFNEIENLCPSLIELSDWMADNPEISGEEIKISRKVSSLLKENNFDVTEQFMDIPTAFSGEINYSKGKNISFLMEYDALPGIGHGCGHNISGCISLLAALALSRHKECIKGSLRLVGTPDEEAKGPKVQMTNFGAFDDCDFAMMIHMCNDSMIVKPFVALDAIEFVYTGRTSHAGTSPWLGVNALNGVQLLFHAIDMMRQHVKPDVRMHGVILEGGLGPTPNMVPERAVARFQFRAHSREYLDQVVARVMDCAAGAALATGTEFSYSYFEPKADEMKRNSAAEALVSDIYQEIGVSIDPLGDYETISSDVFRVSQKCPTIHSYLAICNREHALHTASFAKATKSKQAHDALLKGAKIMALTALKIYWDDEVSGEIKADAK